MEKLTGHGQPHKHLPGEVGQYYEDLNTGDIYECLIAQPYSPTHGWPVGGYIWDKVLDGDDVELTQEVVGGGNGSIDALIERSVTEINSNAKKIANHAFFRNDNLVTANFPAATSVGEYAFSRCSNLQTTDIPAVTSIGDYAFSQCVKLKTIDLPAVTSFGEYVFQGSFNLSELILRSETVCDYGLNMFFEINFIKNKDYIYVPSALIDLYKSATGWTSHKEYFRALEDYTVDGTITGALDPEKTTPRVKLEVEKITSNTYENSTDYSNEEFVLLYIYPKTNGTVSITYGGLTKTITDTSGAAEPAAQQVFFGTFNGVSDSVTTPYSGTLTITGDYRSFGVGVYARSKTQTAYCSCITAVNDFGDVTSIGEYAFAYCSGLGDITIPDSVISIAPYAFEGWSGLATIRFANTDGWFVAESSSATSGTPVDVTNAFTNQELLAHTYKDYYWKRA